ncbi:FtsX-like permease family protein [Amycolatopsis sp. NPDC005961]|uniref:ABC transporter permease n=1 Tax=Amycolatopsis sp. NPDC005961 TaxID=3156720 RepID=UPI0033DD7A31
MILLWLGGLLRRRSGRLFATAGGIALAVALVAALGSFLAASQATMTARALRSVAVAWQVEVQPGGDPDIVQNALQGLPGTGAVRTVHVTRTSALLATTGGTTQTTGPGVVLGLPPGYAAAFPEQIRQLSGSPDGVLIAQQTASNLHVHPGDRVVVGGSAKPVTIAGVVDLPQADTLFQKVGAPPQTQPSAPPDNVLLLPESVFADVITGNVVTQFHVARDAPASQDPATAYETEIAAAHNFEAQVSGAALVGNNVGAALDAARGDAAYAQLLFLFLGLPGVVLAALLTSALVEAGSDRRRAEQALLRTRGHTSRAVAGIAVTEAAFVAALGGGAGLVIAAVTGRLAFGPAPEGRSATAWWYGIAVASGLVITTVTVLVPAITGLRGRTVTQTRQVIGTRRSPWWSKAGLDVLLLVAALVVFWASSGNGYSLVLAPEGVPAISVSYWAFLGPALLWLGAAAVLWRLTTLGLKHGRVPLRSMLRPLSGRLARPGAAALARQSRPVARAIVLLALALSFAASTAVFDSTYEQQAEADAQLTNGADVTVTEPPAAEVTPAAGTQLQNVAGVRHVEPVQHRFAYVGADLQDLYGIRPDSIRQVTALRDAYFQGGTAAELMATLAHRPDAILVSAETVKDFQLSPGDLINLRVQDSRTKALRTVPFHYSGIVKEFPTAPKDSFFVANAAYLAQATGSGAVGAFLVDTGGSNQPDVAGKLRAQLGTAATVTDITETRAHVGSSLTSVNLHGLTRLELTFAVLIAAGAGGIVLAVGLAERRRSLAIMAVLGARRRQLRGLVLGEGLVVIAGGLIGGGLIAWGLSRMLVKVLTGVFDPPPDTIAVPWTYLAVTVAAVAVALVVAALAGARASTRPAVEELREL